MITFVRLLPGADPQLVDALRRAGCEPVRGTPPAPFVRVTTPDEVRAAAARGASLWLRGHEAGGAVSGSTALVLIRAAASTGRPWVAEGLGTRAMAAAVAVGAAGIVIDAHLWACTDSPLHPDHRASLRAATSGRDTEVIGEAAGHRVRLWSRSAPAARTELRALLDADELERATAAALDRWWERPEAPVPAPEAIAEAAHHGERTTAEAARAIIEAVEARAAIARAHHPLRSDPLGCGHPVVQGPMANVAESPALAEAVHAAGAMPFVALGALAPEAAREVLDDAAEADVAPWGVGVIGFDVMPHRDAHLDAIEALGARGPAAVTLAGGSPALARDLAERGMEPWLHTPSGRLAEQALEHGVRAIILEGHEAGGHVGRLTSSGLWEEGLAAVEAHGTGAPLVVLAGGIGDAVSAAFAGAMAAGAHRAGARVALQAGTAFFFTHDILEAGQITAACQEAALSCRETVLVGATVNLPLRCAPNPFTDEARALEQRWGDEGVPRTERRTRLEHHNLGRTRIAARGIERHPDWGVAPEAPHYREVPRDRQRDEGAFTMGQGASVTGHLCSVAEVVAALSTDAAALLEQAGGESPRWGAPARIRPKLPASAPARPAVSSDRSGDVAIVGLGCVLPGAPDVAAYWDLLLDGLDAVDRIPPERWEEGRYHHPDAGPEGPPLTYSRWAGAVQLDFDPLDFRIPPKVVPTLDPSQRLALVAAAQAVRDAGWERPGAVDRRRSAVVLGNAMGGEYAKHSAVRIRFREVLRALEADELAAGWSVPELCALEARIEARLAERLPPVEVDSMAGLLSNVVAGRVAAWLDWMGGNLTVDAACAASLAAVAVAVDWLRSGRCDAVLAGGVDTDLAPETYVGFARTRALSTRGSSPFSAHADGFVMGEGGAVLALKRLDDALRDGDPVWAVLRGVGQSSDGRGRGITAPNASGQRLAMERAAEQAGFSVADVDLIEAHGTGTPLGDRTEVSVLAEATRDRTSPAWLGSVKSNIGHLKSGAGAAGLLKATLAVHAGVVPPTLHAAPLNPALPLGIGAGLALPRGPVALSSIPARAAVSAFGFGGTNFQALLEAPPEGANAPARSDGRVAASRSRALPPDVARWRADDPSLLVLAFGADDREALARAVAGDRPSTPAEATGAPWRCAVVCDLDARDDTLARVAEWLPDATPGQALGTTAFVGSGPARPVIACVPGQGAQRAGALDAVALWPGAGPIVGALSAALLRTLGEDVFTLVGQGDAVRRDPLSLHATLYTAACAWSAVLDRAGVPVEGALGHSLGALGALVAAGRARPADLLDAVLARGRALAACPEGAMLAVRLDEVQARELADQHGLSLAAVNAPGSCVLSGSDAAIEAAAATLPSGTGRRLAVARAYHSPAVAPAAAALATALTETRFVDGAPVWSTRTAQPEADPSADLVASVEAPVRFADAVRAASDDLSDALLLELGPGHTLTALARSLGRSAVALDPTPGDRGRGTVAAAAALLAAGHAGLVEHLPGTLGRRALPAPIPRERAPTDTRRPAATAVPAVAAPADLRDRARAVQDLRIAALADPALAPAYEEARSALLAELARRDAGTPSQARAAPAPEPAPRVEANRAPVAPPAVPEPEPTAPEPVDATPASDLEQAVLDAICEVTGYPPDFVRPDADLEADLGVDSIRKMEILGLLEQRLGFTTAESDYGTLAEADLHTLVAHIRHRLDGADDAEQDPTAVRGTTATITVASREPAALEATEDSPPAYVWWPDDTAPEDVDGAVAALQELAHGSDRPAALGVVAPDDHAAAAAAVGFARSLAREWAVPLRVVHTHGPVDPNAVHAALTGAGPSEVHLQDGRSWRTHPVVVDPDPAESRPSVWVVTGGGDGIVVPCLRALADAQPRVLLLGRTDPDGDDARSERVRANLQALRRDGVDVTWAICDLTDAAAVSAAVSTFREAHGPIDAVLHAAGALADGPAEAATEAHRRTVLGAKWHGARHLVDATADDDLALWCVFSSVTAARGNPGQTLYGAANAALETLRHPRARRHLALAWTAWSEVGMAADPRLLALLERRGIHALDPAEGAAAFRALVRSACDGAFTVTAEPADADARERWPLGAITEAAPDGWTFRLPLDPEHPALADHRVAGRPLVPAALWVCAMLEAARLLAPDERARSLVGFDVSAPTFVDRPRDDVRVTLCPARGGWTATVRTADAVVATAQLAPCDPPARRQPPLPLDGSEPAASLYRPDVLFHGPSWRVLERVRTNGNGRAEADLRSASGDDGSPTTLAGAVDGAHQLLSAWSGRATGHLGLPVGAGRWVMTAAETTGPLRLETVARSEGNDVLADVIAVDPTGRVVLCGEGVRLQAAARYPGSGGAGA